jgi:hypothetical protein
MTGSYQYFRSAMLGISRRLSMRESRRVVAARGSTQVSEARHYGQIVRRAAGQVSINQCHRALVRPVDVYRQDRLVCVHSGHQQKSDGQDERAGGSVGQGQKQSPAALPVGCGLRDERRCRLWSEWPWQPRQPPRDAPVTVQSLNGVVSSGTSGCRTKRVVWRGNANCVRVTAAYRARRLAEPHAGPARVRPQRHPQQ